MRFLTLLFLLMLLSGCNPYHVAWTTTATFREVAYSTESAIATSLRVKVKECSQKYSSTIQAHNDCVKACIVAHKPDVPELAACKRACRAGQEPGVSQYEACIKRPYDANNHWITYARPAINTALTTTVAFIQLAEASKDKKLPWLDYLRSGICVLLEVLNQWKDLFPDNLKKHSMFVTGTLVGLVCKK